MTNTPFLSLNMKLCENPLVVVYANQETRQIPTSLLHELVELKIEYGFEFEYFVLHLKSGLLK